ncbi:cytochrome P450 [Arsenicicoccus sp. MKL-02]|uniref:Cytochrome P450 n=1 Tax=Arsenicicoccus cauae TaxID=2663847 RepID=A0A6I3ISM5_9MICO|nr:cytochrome P450 [Arsenicicoccus cauae]
MQPLPEAAQGSNEQWAALVLRRALTDVNLHGVDIPAGSLVHVLLASANRDPRQYPDPDTFDISRPTIERHMAFGGGPHFCPGTALSRLLADLSFRSWYPHVHRLSLDPADPPTLRLTQGSFGFARLPFIIGD